MLVWVVETNAATGETTRRQVEMPGVVTPEAQAITDAANAQAEATVSTNERTIGDALLTALQSNQQAIAQLVAWRTTGPGAGTANLTAAQQSLVARQTADHLIALFRQSNGSIRLIKRQLSTADLNSAAKVNPTV